MRVIEAITRGEPIGSSLMRIFDTSIPGDDEYDGRNALGCRDLFCEKYFEANQGADVMRDVLRDAGYLTRSIRALRRCLRGLSYATFFASRFCAA
jgi:hypothetical protein